MKKILLLLLLPIGAFAQVTFSNVTSSAGVAMHVQSRWSTSQTWGDYNNDGNMDVYVTSWGQAATGQARNALYRNLGDGTFANVAQSTGVDLFHNSTSAVFGDFDNDGDLDLFVANFSEGDVVFKNLLVETGSATFQDVTSSMSFVNSSIGRSKSGVWGDYDNDGYLDLYVSKYWGENALLKNNSGTSFSLVSSPASDVRDSETANFIDFDDDGDVDLYVVNREQENRLYVNTDGKFEAADLGLNDTQFGRFAQWMDYDNNNRLDLFIANIGANSFYSQSLGGDFTEISNIANVRSAPAAWDTWGLTYADYDGDGDLDLFFTGGFDETSPTETFSGTMGAMLMENFSNVFVDRTETAGLSRGTAYGGSEYGSFASSAAFADYDNDGDPDLMVTNTLENILYKNDKAVNNFLKVTIDDQRDGYNRNGFGAKIRVFNTLAPTFPAAMREVISGQNPSTALFGLADGNTYTVEITFLKAGTETRTQSFISNVTVPLDTIIVIQ